MMKNLPEPSYLKRRLNGRLSKPFNQARQVLCENATLHVYFIHFAGSVNPVQKTRLVTYSELLNYFQTVDLSQQAVRKKRLRYFS